MKSLLSSILHLFYPHSCESCGADLTESEVLLCLRCNRRLPQTGHQHITDNAVEKLFWGRIDIRHGMAAYYYRKFSLLQHLIYQFKYNHREDIAVHLGRQMGLLLQQSRWLYEIDGIVAVPMHPSKVRQRGYNQAIALAKGIAAVTGKPLMPEILSRNNYAPSQTDKDRLLRWQNVSGMFDINDKTRLTDQHLLLIDDVLTTGATTEACGRLLLEAGAAVSICTLAFAHH